MKKRNILITLMVVLVGMFLVACNNNGDDDIDNDNVELNVGLNSVTNNDMYAILNDGNSGGIFIYVGLSTCPHCHAFEPVLSATLTELEKGIRHFEADTERALDDESAMPMMEILTVMMNQTNNQWEGHVPAMLYLVDGEVVDFMIGNVPAETIIEFFERNGGLEQE